MDYKTSFRPCWKCGQITTIVETDVRFLTDPDVGEELRAKYPFFYPDFSKEAENSTLSYYMNHCESCGERQGDNYLFITQLLETEEKSHRKIIYPEFDGKPIIIPKARQTTLDEYFQ